MKKKPIYLWVLLIFSALLSAMSLFGIISPVPTAEGMSNLETSASGVNATYAKELVDYTIKVSEHGLLSSAFSWLSYLLFQLLWLWFSLFVKTFNWLTTLILVMSSLPSLVLSTTLSAFRMRFHFLQILISVWERSLVPKVQPFLGSYSMLSSQQLSSIKCGVSKKELTETQEEEELA